MSTGRKSMINMGRIFISAFVSFCTIVNAKAGQESGNLLPNAGFEEKGKVWIGERWSGKGTKAARKWTGDAHSGKWAIEITGLARSEKEGPRGLFYSPAIGCSPGMHTISGYYKTAGKARATASIYTYSTDQPVHISHKPKKHYHKMEPSATWTFFKRAFWFEENCRQARVLLRGGGIGSVFFDDVRFEKSSSPLNALLFPGRWAYGDEVYLIDDNVAPVTFVLSGDKALLKYPVAFDVVVPAGIKLYGVMPMAEKSGTMGGSSVNSYTMELSKSDIESRLSLKKTLSYRANIVLWAETSTPIENGKLRWRCRSAGANSKWEEADIIVKPAIAKGPRPKEFKVLFAWSLYNRVPRELWDRVYSLYRDAGINCYLVTGSLGSPGGWKDYCIKRFTNEGGKLIWNTPDGTTSPIERALEKRGGWQRILEQGADVFTELEKGLTDDVAALMDGYQWDFEPWMQTKAIERIYTDEAAITLFAKKIGVDRSELTTKLLKTTHKKAYTAFYDEILADVIRLWKTFHRRRSPDALLLMVHGTGRPGTQLKYELYDDTGVIHAPMVYLRSATGFYERTKGLMSRISGKVWPLDSTGLIKSKGRSVARPPWLIRMDILSVASLGATGWGHWPDLNRAMDGLYLWEMARAAREIGTVEDFFHRGKRIDDKTEVEGLAESETELKIKGKSVKVRYPDWRKSLIHHSYRLGELRLITVFNTDTKKMAYVNVSINDLPSGKYYLYDTIAGAAFIPSRTGSVWDKEALRQGITITVSPKDAVFLRASYKKESGAVKKIDLSDVRREYLGIRERAQKENEGNSGGVISKDGLKITWGDVDDDGSVEVVLESSSQRVWISPSGGRLWGWTVAGRKGDLIRRGESLGVCMDDFLLPRRAHSFKDALSPYRVVNRVIENGKASVTLERSIQDDNAPQLFISKTYSIKKGQPVLEVDLVLSNEDIKPVHFSYWSRNSFRISKEARLVYPSQERIFVEADRKRNRWVVRSGLTKEQAKVAHAATSQPIAKGWFATYNAAAREAVVVHVDYDALLQVYKWEGGTSDTLEWMYQPVVLAPGRSWKTRLLLEHRNGVAWNE